MCQSLYACTVARARSLSEASWNMPPANPAKVGKHIDAKMPLRFMSRTRSWMSYAPGRISAKPIGSKPHSSLGQLTTAFRPIEPICWPSNNHFSLPSSPITTCGTRSRYFDGEWRSNMSGGSTTWSSMLTRIRSSTCMAVLPRSAACPHRIALPQEGPARRLRRLQPEERGGCRAVGHLPTRRLHGVDRPRDQLLVGRPPTAMVLEADAEVTATRQGELGQVGGEEIATDDGDRPRQRAVAEELEVRVERALRGREPEREAAVGLGLATAEVEAQHRAGRQLPCAPVRERRAQEPGLEDRHAGYETVLVAQLPLVLDVGAGVHIGERRT